MKDLSYQQKIAMMRILLDIIHADGRIDARETFYFNKMKEDLGLNNDDRKVVEEKNSLLALSQLRCFDEEQKEYFAKVMGRMIIVDEDVNVNEVNIYNIVCDFCGIEVMFEDFISETEINNLTYSDAEYKQGSDIR